MTEHIQMEAGCVVQVSFKRKRFFLLVPDADKPSEGDRPRAQADGYPGIVEPVSSEAEVGLEQSLTQPARVEHLTFVGAGSFHPVQCCGTLATVVARKIEKPRRQQNH